MEPDCLGRQLYSTCRPSGLPAGGVADFSGGTTLPGESLGPGSLAVATDTLLAAPLPHLLPAAPPAPFNILTPSVPPTLPAAWAPHPNDLPVEEQERVMVC